MVCLWFQVRYSSLVDSLLLSGAFSERKVFSWDHERDIPQMDQEECKEYAKKCHRVFELQLEERLGLFIRRFVDSF